VLRQDYETREMTAPAGAAPVAPPPLPQLESLLEQHKPLLRGWFHAVACVGATAFTLLLYAHSQPRAVALAPLLYGLSMIELYAVSATFHLGTWRKGAHRVLRSLDHASIYITIACTFTALCAGVLRGIIGGALIGSIWLLALAGVLLVVRFPRVSRARRTLLYVALGWTAAPLLLAVWVTLPHLAALLLALGGLCYLVGALVYSRRSPDPLPRLLGYHEVFHLLVIAGNALCALVVLVWLVPHR
jgi:hemolysin III